MSELGDYTFTDLLDEYLAAKAAKDHLDHPNNHGLDSSTIRQIENDYLVAQVNLNAVFPPMKRILD